MKLPNILGKFCLWVGMIALAGTATLHITLGVTPLEAGIANGFITKAPNMAPEELLGIWICFSVVFYVLLAGWTLERLIKKQSSSFFAGSIALAAIGSAIVINSLIPGHIAFNLLLFPGLLILAGILLEQISFT